MAGDFPCFVHEGAVSAICCLPKLQPFSFTAEPCLLVWVRLVVVGLDGPGSWAASLMLALRFCIRKCVMDRCFCRCGTVVADVPRWLVEGSGSATAGCIAGVLGQPARPLKGRGLLHEPGYL